MITDYTLTNFESWAKVHVKLHPGVNAFVGASDMGKSGLLRGLNWPINNKPGGDSFRSRWGGDTLSTIVFDDGAVVKRGKSGKTKNFYSYILDGKEEPLTAFGAGAPPEEISQIINMGEINQQFQMDTPFLLHTEYSPGKVASWLNKAADLEIIDISLSSINSKQKHIKSELVAVKSSQDENEAELKGLAFIDVADGELFALEQLEKELTGIHGKINTLSGAITSLEENGKNMLGHSAIIAHSGTIEVLTSLQSDIAANQVKQNGLSGLVNTLEKNKTALDKHMVVIDLGGEVEKLQKACADHAKVVDSIENLSSLITAIEINSEALCKHKSIVGAEKELTELQQLNTEQLEMSSKIAKLSTLGSTLEDNETSLAENSSKIVKLQADFEELMPDTCPLCGAVDG